MIFTSLNLVDLFQVTLLDLSVAFDVIVHSLFLESSLTPTPFLLFPSTSLAAVIHWCPQSSWTLSSSYSVFPSHLYNLVHDYVFNRNLYIVSFPHLYCQVKVIKCLFNSTNWTSQKQPQIQKPSSNLWLSPTLTWSLSITCMLESGPTCWHRIPLIFHASISHSLSWHQFLSILSPEYLN